MYRLINTSATQKFLIFWWLIFLKVLLAELNITQVAKFNNLSQALKSIFLHRFVVSMK